MKIAYNNYSNKFMLLILLHVLTLINSNCDISKIEKQCVAGAAYCNSNNKEYCSICRPGRIIASPYKDTFRCIKMNYTNCLDSPNCLNCNENGKCIHCGQDNVSYDGICLPKDKYKCEMNNCISCVEFGKKCIRCKEGYSLFKWKVNDSGIITPISPTCIENKSNCAEFNKLSMCYYCHNGYLINYDYNSCRKFDL